MQTFFFFSKKEVVIIELSVLECSFLPSFLIRKYFNCRLRPIKNRCTFKVSQVPCKSHSKRHNYKFIFLFFNCRGSFQLPPKKEYMSKSMVISNVTPFAIVKQCILKCQIEFCAPQEVICDVFLGVCKTFKQRSFGLWQQISCQILVKRLFLQPKSLYYRVFLTFNVTEYFYRVYLTFNVKIKGDM